MTDVELEPFDVVVVPFPFSERPGTKRRPALVVSTRSFAWSGHVVAAMITTSTRRSWPGDWTLHQWREAGLPRKCKVRLKLFTLDRRLVLARPGQLGSRDRAAVEAALREHLAVETG